MIEQNKRNTGHLTKFRSKSVKASKFKGFRALGLPGGFSEFGAEWQKIRLGNNPMVGATVAVQEAMNK